jgi:protein TonB
MRLRLNIILSLAAHAAIITMAFMVGRGWTSPAPADPLTVSLVSELSEIKILKAQGQKKQTIHSPASPGRDASVSAPHDNGAAVKEKPPAETGKEKSHISPAREGVTGETNPEKSPGAKSGSSVSFNNAHGMPPSSFAVGHQGVPAGNAASGNPGHEGDQPKGANTEDGKAIRKAVEKSLIYPLFARKRGLEGTALAEFTVNSKGYPEDIRIIGSTGYGILDTAAKDSMIRAAPFAVGKGRYEIPITFRLRSN